ncbi:GNAT family N-acetyltransferase [Brevibacterium atlanticum]|uniref:GNAT family N-acetyltransferase n=1 Tax=Brevibacterium atlanticum TaxID=2697563 RepID=UPI00142158BD|nr:GNAT family N-acetyltransferase [Brevibacterium atlanticum]
MDITRIRPGDHDGAAIEAVLPEILAFDTQINHASGLGEDFDPREAELRRELSSSTAYETHTTWIVRLGGSIVAKGVAFLPLSDNRDTAELWCAVHPAHRGQGIGGRLLTVMEEEMRIDGRTRLTSYCELPATVRDAAPGRAHLAAQIGKGSLPSGQPDVAFLHRHGYSFIQLERCSVAAAGGAEELSGDPIGDEAADGYVIETWQGPTPEHRLDQVALLHQRMSTDVPGAAEFGDEEVWDADRVRTLDAERTASAEVLTTSLALLGQTAAGFTEVAHSADRPQVGWQGSTIVAREHRGHRLGARLKFATLVALGRESSVERIYTWNAVENSWMLAINDAVGFETWAWVGVWRKVLEAPGTDDGA